MEPRQLLAAIAWAADAPSPGSANVATAPTVLSTAVNNGEANREAQRSTVTSLALTLQGDVDIAAGAFQRSDASGQTGALVGTSFTTALVGGNTVATISFSGAFMRSSAGASLE